MMVVLADRHLDSAHPQHRAKISAIVNCMYGVGSTACSWLALATINISGEWSWRSLTLLQCIPGVLVLFCIYWIPESPRWLVAKERYEDAEAMLARYHGNGDRTNETVVFEFLEMKKTIALEFSQKKSSSYLDFARTPGNRYRVMLLISLALVSQYSGSNLFGNYANKIYVGAGITNETDKILVRVIVVPSNFFLLQADNPILQLSGGQTILSLVVSITCSLFIDRFGRRPLFLTSTTGIVLAYMGWTIISAQFERTQDLARFGYPQIAFIWLYTVGYQIAWTGVMAAYALEIMPYNLRAKAGVITGFCFKALGVLGRYVGLGPQDVCAVLIFAYSYTNPIAWDNFTAAGHAWALAMFYTVSQHIVSLCGLLVI